jgi:predicted Rossmann-fold nucleotide-binding protein
MLKILSSAQSFGYGPCSKLVTFVNHIRAIYDSDVKVDFIGDDISLVYALKNSPSFNNVFEYKGEYPATEDYDLVISAMNPYTAIWGWFSKKRVIYIDSLFWFWKWDKKNFPKIERLIQELRSANNVDELWSILKEVDDHHLQYIAHKLSSISLVQKFSDSKKAPDDLFRKNISDLIEVGPIIKTSLKEKTEKRDRILISLGGLYSPLNRLKESTRYANFVLNLLDEFIEQLPNDIEVILTTNPELASNITSKIDRLTITSLNNEQFLKTLNKSILLFTPPSITTIYESLYYDVPVIFLPEQHDGHFPNFLRLSSKKISILRKIFPELLINTRIKKISNKDADQEILRIQSLIKKLSSSPSNPLILDMEKTIKNCVKFATNITARNSLLVNQQQTVMKEVDVIDKVKIEDILKKLLESNILPQVTKRYQVGIISSAIEQTKPSLIQKSKWIGETLASSDINIATGASIGFSHLIGLAAKEKGAKLTGYSPAKNSFLHQKQPDNASINDFDELYFNGYGFTARSLNFLTSVDAVIMLAGRIGTLSEFTIAFEEGIPVFVLKGFGGISDHIEQILYLTKKEKRANISVVLDKKDMINKLIKFLNANYYKIGAKNEF